MRRGGALAFEERYHKDGIISCLSSQIWVFTFIMGISACVGNYISYQL